MHLTRGGERVKVTRVYYGQTTALLGYENGVGDEWNGLPGAGACRLQPAIWGFRLAR